MSGPDPLRLLPLLTLGAFAAGSAMRMLDPILPLLAAHFGVPVAGLAGVIAGFALGYGGGQVLVGPLADRLGKLRVLAVALFCFGVLLMAAPLMPDLVSFVALRVLLGLAAGAVFPVALAWVGDQVDYARRQGVIGRLLRGMVFSQLLAGPFAGLLGGAAGWQAVFLSLGAMASAIALMLGRAMGREAWRSPPPRPGRGLGLADMARVLALPRGRWLMGLTFLNGFALFGGAFPYVGSLLVEEHGLTTAAAGLVVAAFAAGSFTYTGIAQRLVRHFGEVRLARLGAGLVAAGLAAMALGPPWWGVALLQAAFGLAFFMFHGTMQTQSTEVLPEARGAAVSLFVLALFLGQTVGAVAMGAVLAAGGYAAVFWAAAGILATVAALAGQVKR
ncbi:MAG: MFS transporter [Acetobacteraceae bacterium]|nr:MFS transporter [Acetobacteraceae bacterium]